MYVVCRMRRARKTHVAERETANGLDETSQFFHTMMSSVSIVHRIWTTRPDIEIHVPAGVEVFRFSTASRAVTGPLTYPMGNGGISRRDKQLGCEADHRPLFDVEGGGVVELYVRKLTQASCRRLQYPCMVFVLNRSQALAEIRYDSVVWYSELTWNSAALDRSQSV